MNKNFTEKEVQVMMAVINSEYNDGYSEYPSTYVWDLEGAGDMTMASIRGCLASLVKKEAVSVCEDAEDGNTVKLLVKASEVEAMVAENVAEAVASDPIIIALNEVEKEAEKAVKKAVKKVSNRAYARVLILEKLRSGSRLDVYALQKKVGYKTYKEARGLITARCRELDLVANFDGKRYATFRNKH